jgi:hypothetical protein
LSALPDMSAFAIKATPTKEIDPVVEKAARAIIISSSGGKADPDMPVQAGTPNVYGTPGGDVFAVSPGAEVPMWRMYIATARALLEVVRGVDKQP